MSRVPRHRPATVRRWLHEGIAPRTFDRLVSSLAPSAATAARWQREGRIPERALLAIKPPPRKPVTRPATVARWIEEGIAPRTFDRLVLDLAPTPATAARWRREAVIPARRLEALARPPAARRPPAKPKAAKASTVQRWITEGIPARTFDRLARELAPSPATAARWRREGVIPEARLVELVPVPRPRKPKKPKPRAEVPPPPVERPPERLPPPREEPPEAPPELPELAELQAAREEAEDALAALEQARLEERAEREAIREEGRAVERPERPFEDEAGVVEPPPPEDVYPLPTRDLSFFREHDRTDMEGITQIKFDPETGRIVGVNDQGQRVAAYLFTEENGQPKSGPDSLRWALATDLENYVAHINRTIRERYGDNTMRGAFGRFGMPGR